MVKKMWGGRFSKKTDPLVEAFTKSIQFDHKIALWDLMGSRFHVWILEKSGYLTTQEAGRLINAMLSITASINNGTFKYNPKSEDIHTNIQNLLQEKVGDLALKLHTARSRNDQVAFATKFYCKVQLNKLREDVALLREAIASSAQKNKHIIIPGFTHMQHAQPIYLKDYLLAYAQMLERDSKRMDAIFKNMKITLGAGALAGTPIESREYNLKASEVLKEHREYAHLYNIEATSNSIDAVSDRDFVIETISCLSIVAMHLSRFAEDLIIWMTEEFDFIELDESFCTGSSLMPQKKNPDVLELIRGYAGRLYGNLVSVLTMMKGLPLTYNRDMQLDKEPLFNSFEIVSSEVALMTAMVKGLTFNEKKIKEHLKDESLYATDLVYYLVDKKIPFKEAHTIVGKLVRHSADARVKIKEMPEATLKTFCDKFVKNEIAAIFDPEVSVMSKKSIKRKRGG